MCDSRIENYATDKIAYQAITNKAKEEYHAVVALGVPLDAFILGWMKSEII